MILNDFAYFGKFTKNLHLTSCNFGWLNVPYITKKMVHKAIQTFKI